MQQKVLHTVLATHMCTHTYLPGVLVPALIRNPHTYLYSYSYATQVRTRTRNSRTDLSHATERRIDTQAVRFGRPDSERRRQVVPTEDEAPTGMRGADG